MKIEENYDRNEPPNSADVMEMCLSELQELTQYEPTTEEDGFALEMISTALRIIGEKARLYEQMVGETASNEYLKN